MAMAVKALGACSCHPKLLLEMHMYLPCNPVVDTFSEHWLTIGDISQADKIQRLQLCNPKFANDSIRIATTKDAWSAFMPCP